MTTMKYLASLLLMLVPMSGLAADQKLSPERRAFDQAARAMLQYQKTGEEGDPEIAWARGLKRLALSKSKEADDYLVQLAFFSLDGAFGEEYSCAASKRGRRFSTLLQRALRDFDRANPCFAIADHQGIDRGKLCATKQEFSLVLKDYGGSRPRPDTEAGCPY